MKKVYELGHLRIDLRKFYQYYEEKGEVFQEIGWSDCWYCGDKDCSCGQLEDLLEKYPDLKTRLVPWYRRVFTLSYKDRYFYGIIGFIIGLMF